MSAGEDAIKAAMAVARDIAEGRLDPEQLAAVTAAEARAAFGRVVGPGDALWDLHCDIARQAVAKHALPADELAEWLAVWRSSEQVKGPCWIEQALAAVAAEDETEED